MGKVVRLPQGFCMSQHRNALEALSVTIGEAVNKCMQDGVPLGMIVAIVRAHDVGVTDFMLAQDE